MGNNQTISTKIERFERQNWIQAGQDQQNALFTNVNPYRRRLLANVVTHQLIQQYQLNFITQQDYNSYITQLSYRQIQPSNPHNNNPKSLSIYSQSNINNNTFSQNHKYIYPIRYFVNKSKNQMCTTIHTGYLYIDKVDLRLKQINDIPFQDLLYMYKATLNGFKLLYQKVGYFDIVQEMIFINKKGQVKVWMNTNLAKNYPNYQKTTHQKNGSNTSNNNQNHSYTNRNSSQPSYSYRQNYIYGSQADMIKKLILMIQKNSDQYVFQDSNYHTNQQQRPNHQLFSQFLQNQNLFDKLSFIHCLQQFQNYLTQNNLHSPDYMRSIPQLFSPDDQNYKPQQNYQQSHVNQITSQHLTQMKKKFQPMETIFQDQNFNTKTTNKQLTSIPHFHQSHVQNYTPQAFSAPREQPSFHQYQQVKVVRPRNSQHNDLNQSRYSHKSNNVGGNSYQHLQRSSNSNQEGQKPNSVSTLNYMTNLPIKIGSQPIFINRQPQIVCNSPNTIINGGVTPHYIANENNQRNIYIPSPPPSFRIMGGLNNTSQNVYPSYNGQAIIVSSNPVRINKQQILQQQNYIIRKDIKSPVKVPLIPNNVKFVKNQPINSNNKFNVNNSQLNGHNNSLMSIIQQRPQLNRQVKQQNKGQKYEQKQVIKRQQQFIKREQEQVKKQFIKRGQEQVIKRQQTQKDRKQNKQKSRIQYYTKKATYQLDQQIAQDLQKFLGLKVN